MNQVRIALIKELLRLKLTEDTSNKYEEVRNVLKQLQGNK